MKRLILWLSLSALAYGQSAGVGQVWTAVTGTLQSGATATGNGSTLAVQGLSTARLTVNCSVACSGGTTVNFEGSQDGTNYVALSGEQTGTATIASTVVNQGTTPTIWEVNVAGLQLIRARISGYSAGTITVTATATAAPANPKTLNGNLFLGGTLADGNSGNKSAQTQRVVLATDQPALTNKLLVTPDSVALPANQTVDVNKLAGTTTDTNSGSKSAGTLRVVLATDQPALTNKLLVTPDSVALPANQSVNINQINGVTPLMGSGIMGTGSPRVTIASDNDALTVKQATGTNLHTVIDSGTVTTVSTVTNLSQLGGTAVAMNTGTRSAGTQRVTIATDDVVPASQSGTWNVRVTGNAGGAVDAATGAAPPANAIYTAGLASGATGGLLGAPTVCDQWVAINGTASAQLIAGVSGRKIYFCSMNLQMNGGANTISFVSGTGTVCATGITSVPGYDGATTAANGYSFAANGGIVLGNASVPFARTTNNADNFCILVGSATRVVGGINYAIY